MFEGNPPGSEVAPGFWLQFPPRVEPRFLNILSVPAGLQGLPLSQPGLCAGLWQHRSVPFPWSPTPGCHHVDLIARLAPDSRSALSLP